jgi:adhesin HecA-like repeat protein
LTLQAATLRNAAAGVIQGETAGSIAAASLDNAGTLLLTRQATGAAQVAITGQLANSGTLQAGGDLALTAQTLANSGTVLAHRNGQLSVATLNNQSAGALLADGDLTLQATAFQNAAGGTAQAGGALQVAAATLVNDGTLAAGGAMGVATTGLFDNHGVLAAGGNLDVQAASLQNTGGISAVGGASLLADGVVNSAGGTIRGATGLSIEAGAAGLDNAGLLQAGDGTVGELATLGIYTPDGAVRNTGDLQGGALDVTAASLDNSATITGGAGGSVLTALSGGIDNAATGVITLGDAASGDSLVSARSVSNHGTLQSGAGMALAVGSGGLRSDGHLLAGAALAIGSRDATSYLATLDGVVGAGGLLSVHGDAGSGLRLANAADVRVGAAEVTTGTLDLAAHAALAARGAVTLDVQDLVLPDEVTDVAGVRTVHTARILGALDGGTAAVDVRVGKDFANAGLVFSGTDLNVTAPNIHVGANGALSALGNLHLAADAGALDLAAATPDAAAGTLVNEGLLYAGQGLSARVNGTLTNKASIQGGTVDLLANTVVNNRDIDSLGDLRLVATNLRNEVEGGDRRVFQTTWNEGAANWTKWGGQWDDNDKGGNLDEAQTWVTYFTESLTYLPGEEPTYWPRITAQHNAQLLFHDGKNLGGLVQATDSVRLQGFVAQDSGTALVDGLADDSGRILVAPAADTMASFENNSLALVTTSYERRHTQTRKLKALGPDVKEDWHWCSLGSDVVCNKGYIVPVNIKDDVQAVNPVGYSGARIYTASLEGSGFTFFNEGATTPASFQPAGLQSTQLLVLGRPTPPSVTAQPSALPGAGTRTGWTPIDLEIHPLTVTGSDGQPLQAGLVFGGTRLQLPTGINGLFVAAADPSAGYLIESNPLYQVGSAFAGSDYLRERLGLDTDATQLRLGDGSYEAWVVQQQLLAQTGSMLLKGYGSLAGQMQALWDNAATAATGLGLVWGTALSAQQQAGLQRDIVWMVATEVNGRSVLVPVVYLSQATKDGIRKGAIVAADRGSLTVDGLANSGTIEGVTVDNKSGGNPTKASLVGGGPGSAMGLPPQFRDQSFEIVKAYLLSASSDQTVRYGDVNSWLAANRSNPEALGKVLPYAFERFMSLATGEGVMSQSDKAFVSYVGEYAKAQRIAAVNAALDEYAKWKAGPKLGQHGDHALLTSLFDLGESPPDSIMNLAKAGITFGSDDEAKRIGGMLGSSFGALGAGGAAGGASAALMNQIFPYLGRALASAAGSSITALSAASGPLAIVTATVTIVGQAIDKLVKDASFEKDLRKLKAKYEDVPGSDVQYWLKQKGGPEQILMSMTKMMAG